MPREAAHRREHGGQPRERLEEPPRVARHVSQNRQDPGEDECGHGRDGMPEQVAQPLPASGGCAIHGRPHAGGAEFEQRFRRRMVVPRHERHGGDGRCCQTHDCYKKFGSHLVSSSARAPLKISFIA